MLEWMDQTNNRRLFEPISNVSLAEAELAYYHILEGSAEVA